MVRTMARGRAGLLSVGVCATLSIASVAPSLAADPGTEPATPGAAPWTASELPGDAHDVAAGHGRFVAVGSQGFPPSAAAWTSTDGVSWEESAVGDAPVGSTLREVITTSDGFVAIGDELEADGGEAQRILAWSSPDGLEWDPASVTRPARSGLQALVAGAADGPAGSLMLGSFIGQDLAGQRLWHSADGAAWEPTKLPKVKDPVWETVTALPDGYLLLGQQTLRAKPSNWRSADGLAWQKLKGTPRLFDAAVAADGTVVGLGPKHIWRSQDLKEWEKVWTRPSEWKAGGSNAFEWINWDGSEFLVAGHDVADCEPATDECHDMPLLVSPDGLTWTEAAGPDGLPGADDATWLEGSATLDGSTIVLGQSAGTPVAWLVEGDLVPVDEVE